MCKPLLSVFTALGHHPLIKSAVGRVLEPPLHNSTEKASRDVEKNNIFFSGFNSLNVGKICISFVAPLGYSCISCVLQGNVGCGGRMEVGLFWKSRTDEVFALHFPMR